MKKHHYHTRLATLLLLPILASCAGPEVRHDTRVDRRDDAAHRVDSRSTNRQDNRYDRRDERGERIENRY